MLANFEETKHMGVAVGIGMKSLAFLENVVHSPRGILGASKVWHHVAVANDAIDLDDLPVDVTVAGGRAKGVHSGCAINGAKGCVPFNVCERMNRVDLEENRKLE